MIIRFQFKLVGSDGSAIEPVIVTSNPGGAFSPFDQDLILTCRNSLRTGETFQIADDQTAITEVYREARVTAETLDVIA